MASWNDLPNEVVEHILSYCCADGMRNEVFQCWGRLDLWCYEHDAAVCGIISERIFYFMRRLQFEKRCRTILKGMCVFKPCINHKTDHNGNFKMEWSFKKGILHRIK